MCLSHVPTIVADAKRLPLGNKSVDVLIADGESRHFCFLLSTSMVIGGLLALDATRRDDRGVR